MTAEDWLEVARITIEAKDYCFFITLSESGHVNARLMQPFNPNDTSSSGLVPVPDRARCVKSW